MIHLITRPLLNLKPQYENLKMKGKDLNSIAKQKNYESFLLNYIAQFLFKQKYNSLNYEQQAIGQDLMAEVWQVFFGKYSNLLEDVNKTEADIKRVLKRIVFNKISENARKKNAQVHDLSKKDRVDLLKPYERAEKLEKAQKSEQVRLADEFYDSPVELKAALEEVGLKQRDIDVLLSWQSQLVGSNTKRARSEWNESHPKDQLQPESFDKLVRKALMRYKEKRKKFDKKKKP